jgi:hypothetical protein
MHLRHQASLLLLLALLVGVGLLVLWGWQASSAEVAGRVMHGKEPLAGARVRIQGHTPYTTTDSDGRFHLPGTSGSHDRIAVAHEGFVIQTFPAGQTPVFIVLPRFPADDPAYTWVEPGPQPAGGHNCVNCHGQIYQEWEGSAHARAAVNRHFLNLYDGSDWHGRPGVGWDLRKDNLGGAAVCAACHAPTISAGDSAFADIRQARGVNRRGVHCDFCHKIDRAEVDPRGLTFGRFGYHLVRPAQGQLFFGPLDDAERAGESFSYSPLYGQSRYCASCHEGVIFGVPVYTTYSEWLASPARRQGQECQSCHMRPTGSMTNIAPGKGGIERDSRTLSAHTFPGGQAAMLRRCLRLSAKVTGTPAGVNVHVELRAEHVGHRVPTGFIDRNVLLIVEALSSSGKPVRLRSGTTLSALSGRGFAGKPGRLYAKQLLRRDAPGPIAFWQAHDQLLDTRLVPGRPDRALWSFAAGADRVRVRLVYRRFWQDVAATKQWPDNEITVFEQTWPVRPPR